MLKCLFFHKQKHIFQEVYSRKPMSIMYVLHSLQGHLDGIHDFIFCLYSFKPSKSFIYCGTEFQILILHRI